MPVNPSPAAPAIRISVNTDAVKDSAASAAINSLAKSITDAFQGVLTSNSPSVVLVATPNGSIYSIAVSDAGVVSATLIKSA